jgi:hypothetical protein
MFEDYTNYLASLVEIRFNVMSQCLLPASLAASLAQLT